MTKKEFMEKADAMPKIECVLCYYNTGKTKSQYPCGYNTCESFANEVRKMDKARDLGLLSDNEHAAIIARLKYDFEEDF